MNEPRTRVGSGVVGGRSLRCRSRLACTACGGASKRADSPGNCPDGTVLRGSDCVPPEDAVQPLVGRFVVSPPRAARAPRGCRRQQRGEPASSAERADGRQDAVRQGLRRDRAQARRASGEGQLRVGDRRQRDRPSGPWGKTKASVTLGRNGHVKAGDGAGALRRQARGRLRRAIRSRRFSSRRTRRRRDVVVEWDIEFVKPKH